MSNATPSSRAAPRFGTTQAIALLVTFVSVVLLATPLWRADAELWQSLGVILFAVGMWATGAVPIHITTLILFLLTVLFKIAPPEVVITVIAGIPTSTPGCVSR